MSGSPPPLFVDFYELAMAQAYFADDMLAEATFDLYIRTLPARRNYLLAVGQTAMLESLERLTFSAEMIAYLESFPQFTPAFLQRLRTFRFSGNVDAVREGTPVFAGEPVVQVHAPLPEAQLVETLIINQLHFPTIVASKGVRVIEAARGKPVTDFGSRRAHGLDAGITAAHALYIAGWAATSNVEAGRRYGIPVTGTIAHAYIQAHADEISAFRNYARHYPDTVLLVDTFDTLTGVQHVIDLARELGDAFRVRGIRLDSGDLAALSRRARAMLDAAGLDQVQIVASGGLDEDEIAALEAAAAPIDAYAVGTKVVTSADAPYADAAYKLAAYDGLDRIKLSPGKTTLPGRKQVFRLVRDGVAVRDVITRADEPAHGVPLLSPVMRNGRRLHPRASPSAVREAAERARAVLPEQIRSLIPAADPYRVDLSPLLRDQRNRLTRELGAS